MSARTYDLLQSLDYAYPGAVKVGGLPASVWEHIPPWLYIGIWNLPPTLKSRTTHGH